jgi:uncharacterized membrane protein YhaH (DUF805 family)
MESGGKHGPNETGTRGGHSAEPAARSRPRVSVCAEPARLNSAIAWLFVVGASCFGLGTIPAYVDAVGAAADATTFFVGSIFFTSASYFQLVQAQSPGMTGVDERRQHARVRVRPWAWRPRDKYWLAAATQFPGTLFFNHSTFAALAHNLSVAEADKMVWRPDVFGSVLFLVSSAFVISALGVEFRRPRLRALPWWIAWLNMLGSVAFMVSAIAGFVVPSTGTVLDLPLDNAGTFLGAVCFLVGRRS